MPRRKPDSAGAPRPARRKPAPAPVMPAAAVPPGPESRVMTADDLHYFNEGTHARLYRRLGAHPVEEEGRAGTRFSVWAPSAGEVFVMGDWNGWAKDAEPLRAIERSGIWTGFVAGVGRGARYKYHVVTRDSDYRVDKADPMGFRHDVPPGTASIVWDLDYAWGDSEWMRGRKARMALDAPVSIYEVHLGSWRRPADDPEGFLSYRDMAGPLADHVRRAGFTHVEFLPVMEHPFYGSWGYQVTGYFAPTGRYGTPQDLMSLIDTLHQHGIGVILDWVPSHFPRDEHGLGYFDGSHLYEHADPRRGVHVDWNTFVFNYGRNEVRSFLLSNALFWLDCFHADGLRIDAVSSMLYLDYSRAEGEWVPNEHGGREDLEAVSFLRDLNETVYREYPDVQTIAEESTSWPMVSRPLYVGGLGFGLKWDMGWMHDTLEYMACDPIGRKYEHNLITFRIMYAFHENFVLALSHDEVVYGKGSLIGKMPGEAWNKLAQLKLLLGYMYVQPGKKLLFMGGEFGQTREWNHDAELDWKLLDDPGHAKVLRFVEDLNRAYREHPALHVLDCDPKGFEWMDCSDAEQSVISLLRKGKTKDDRVVAVCNFTPVARHNYRVGVPSGGTWREILNSDAKEYGGSGQGNLGGIAAAPAPWRRQRWSLTMVLPPLAVVLFAPEPKKK